MKCLRQVLDIHLEGIKPEDFEGGNVLGPMQEVLDKSIPVVVSLPPWMEVYWLGEKDGEELLGLVRTVVKREGSYLGQQGLNHKCSHEHKLVDPWHENACLWKRNPSKREQAEFMKEGKDRLFKLIGVESKVYVPPNHLFNEDSLDVADELGYLVFAQRAMLDLPIYKNPGGIFMLPEGNLVRGQFRGAAGYIHYDQIYRARDFYDRAVSNVTSLDGFAVSKRQPVFSFANEILVKGYKAVRDVSGAGKALLKR